MRKQPESYLNSENRYIFHLKTMYKGDFLKLTAMPQRGGNKIAHSVGPKVQTMGTVI